MSLRLTDRINRIQLSPTLAAAAEAARLREQGVDMVDFGPGEPDFPTPEHIKQAAVRALEQNFTKYTPVAGIPALRKAIVEWHAAQLGSRFEPAECVVGTGGKQALFNTICVLISNGDDVLIPAPYWVSFPDIVKYAGGRPVIVETHPEEGFQLTAAQVERAITPKTRMLIVNSPNNPSGAVIPPDEFARIFELCRKRDIWLLSDECYSHFTYDGAKPFSVASLPDAKSHVIIAGSFSKTFSMTGWRMGYALASKPLAEAIAKMQSQSTSNANSITQHAALAAARGPMEPTMQMLAEYARRRTRMLAGLRGIPGVKCSAPQGAFYLFPDMRAKLGKPNGAAASTEALAKQLMEKAHVVVVAGEAFGAPGFLRFSYATSMESIEEGLRRLERFFLAAQSAS